VYQVAYRAPGNQQADWVDLYNRLYRERILFLGQQIDDEITNQVRAESLACSAQGARLRRPGDCTPMPRSGRPGCEERARAGLMA
jgi:hypothetical protein